MTESNVRLIDPIESRELLTLGRVGRVAFVNDEGVQLLPVNYAFVNDVVFVRTTNDSALAGLVSPPQDVVFEADYYDTVYRNGWSVVVRGTIKQASKDEEQGLGNQGPSPWVTDETNILLAIAPTRIDGRRVRGH